eukprot:8540925-Pyramimonas_sp.AAC.1
MERKGVTQVPSESHGCRTVAQWVAQGGPTLRVFSNCDVMRVIMPREEMKLSRLSTCSSPSPPPHWFRNAGICSLASYDWSATR